MAEEFVLVPKQEFLKEQPLVSQITENESSFSQPSKFLSLLQRQQSNNMVENDDEDDQNKRNISEQLNQKNVEEKILGSLKILEGSKLNRAKKLYDMIIKSAPNVRIDSDGKIVVNEISTTVDAINFLYNMQQPTKKIDEDKYKTILKAIGVDKTLLLNKQAKQIVAAEESQEESTATTSKRRKLSDEESEKEAFQTPEKAWKTFDSSLSSSSQKKRKRGGRKSQRF